MPSFVGSVSDALAGAGIDLAALGLAWARVMPTMTIVPAFGLRALPAPARAAMALALRATVDHPLLAAATDISAGIALAVGLGGPLLAASVIVEVAASLVARAAAPAQIHALLAPLRALGTLAILAVVLERLATVLARTVQSAP